MIYWAYPNHVFRASSHTIYVKCIFESCLLEYLVKCHMIYFWGNCNNAPIFDRHAYVHPTSASSIKPSTVYGPVMQQYSLPAIAVDKEEMSSVQSTTIIRIILQQLGLSDKLPTAIQFGGPSELGGLGLIDLSKEGWIEMIKKIAIRLFWFQDRPIVVVESTSFPGRIRSS